MAAASGPVISVREYRSRTYCRSSAPVFRLDLKRGECSLQRSLHSRSIAAVGSWVSMGALPALFRTLRKMMVFLQIFQKLDDSSRYVVFRRAEAAYQVIK